MEGMLVLGNGGRELVKTETRPVRRPAHVSLSDGERLRLRLYAASRGLTPAQASRVLSPEAPNLTLTPWFGNDAFVVAGEELRRETSAGDRFAWHEAMCPQGSATGAQE